MGIQTLYLWGCCGCGEYGMNVQTNDYCTACQRRQCVDCRVDRIIVKTLRENFGLQRAVYETQKYWVPPQAYKSSESTSDGLNGNVRNEFDPTEDLKLCDDGTVAPKNCMKDSTVIKDAIPTPLEIPTTATNTASYSSQGTLQSQRSLATAVYDDGFQIENALSQTNARESDSPKGQEMNDSSRAQHLHYASKDSSCAQPDPGPIPAPHLKIDGDNSDTPNSSTIASEVTEDSNISSDDGEMLTWRATLKGNNFYAEILEAWYEFWRYDPTDYEDALSQKAPDPPASLGGQKTPSGSRKRPPVGPPHDGNGKNKLQKLTAVDARGTEQVEELKLACHYYKMNPLLYRRCGQSGFKIIGHVTQHLKDYHRLGQYHCDRCWESFDSENYLHRHREGESCTATEGVPIDRMDAVPKTRRSQRDKWYWIWSQLFPRLNPPVSPYVDGLESVGLFTQFLSQHVLAELAPRFGSNPLLEQLPTIIEGAFLQFGATPPRYPMSVNQASSTPSSMSITSAPTDPSPSGGSSGSGEARSADNLTSPPVLLGSPADDANISRHNMMEVDVHTDNPPTAHPSTSGSLLNDTIAIRSGYPASGTETTMSIPSIPTSSDVLASHHPLMPGAFGAPFIDSMLPSQTGASSHDNADTYRPDNARTPPPTEIDQAQTIFTSVDAAEDIFWFEHGALAHFREVSQYDFGPEHESGATYQNFEEEAEEYTNELIWPGRQMSPDAWPLSSKEVRGDEQESEFEKAGAEEA